jgi:Zn-dependent protease with chaperone function
MHNRFRKLAISFLLCCFVFITNAQYQFNDYVVPQKIAERYSFSPDKIPLVLPNYAKLSTEDFKAFLQTSAYDKYTLFISGRIYLEWNDVEKYLNAVLFRVVPDSLKGKLHVYPCRSTLANSFALPDGSIFLNIGLLAEMDDEAQLAIVLGHEAAHYMHHDHHFSYKKKLETVRTKAGEKRELRQFENAHDDREQEKAADFLGFELAKKAGYTISSGILLFRTLHYSDMMKSRKAKKTRLTTLDTDHSKKEELLQNHPELKDRVDYLAAYSEKHKADEARKNIELDDTGFLKITNIAKHQNMIILLEGNLYRKCIEVAFMYHLNDPEDLQSLYFLSESLRRYLYTNVKNEDMSFLTEDDYSETFKSTQGIYHDLTRLFVDSVKYQNVKNKLDKEVEEKQYPETYKQAFDYFLSQAIRANITESYLTMALATEDTNVLKSTIHNYLQHPDANYKEYAKVLLENALDSLLMSNKKEIVLCSTIDFVKLNKNEAIMLYEKSEKESKQFFNALLTSAKTYSKKEILSIDSIIEQKFEMAQKIYNCASGMQLVYHKAKDNPKTGSYYNLKKQNNVSLFKISPEYWMFFKEQQLRSIIFYDVMSVVSRKTQMVYFDYYSFDITHVFPTTHWHYSETARLTPKNYSEQLKNCIVDDNR